jgi:ribosomal protein S18 acetylase RimI-like enzyme
LDNLSLLAKKRKVNAKVISVKRNDKIVGWALLSKENSDFHFGYSISGIKTFDAKRDGALFEVFVDPEYRRSGIGSALIKKARKHAGSAQLCIAPHDYKSNKFYEKHKKYKQKRLNWE